MFNGNTYTAIRNSGTLTVSGGTLVGEVLMVAGGGGAGFVGSGGAGAGGVAYISSASINLGTHSVTIGAGGAGSNTNGVNGTAGANTVAFDITTCGGGSGNSSGGSGGGGDVAADRPGGQSKTLPGRRPSEASCRSEMRAELRETSAILRAAGVVARALLARTRPVAVYSFSECGKSASKLGRGQFGLVQVFQRH